MPLLVVVTGPPASGKSTLARDLASSLGVPFLERAAFALLFSVANSNLDAGVDVLVESNFDATTGALRRRSRRVR